MKIDLFCQNCGQRPRLQNEYQRFQILCLCGLTGPWAFDAHDALRLYRQHCTHESQLELVKEF